MTFRCMISFNIKIAVRIISLLFVITICCQIFLVKKGQRRFANQIAYQSSLNNIFNNFENVPFANYSTSINPRHYSEEVKNISDPKIGLCSGYNTANITVCQVFYGRLGNNMFIYAANMCLAKKFGFRLFIPNFLEIVRVFRLSEKTIDFWKLQEFCKYSEHHRGFFETKFNYDNFNISCTRNFTIDGYLQSFWNFMDCEEDIRNEFVFRENLTSKAELAVTKALGQPFCFECKRRNISLIAIHVRREDYVLYDYPMPNVKYYDTARRYFKIRHQNVRFVVLTSPDTASRKWCQDNIIDKTNDTFLLPKNAVEIDMYILIHSDHVIISTGTFGWWGAWLNKNAIVVKWNNLSGDKRWNSSDFYPSHWILLDGPELGNYTYKEKWISV